MITPFTRKTLALILAATAPAFATAQGLQTGPEFLRGGQYLVQPNRGDNAFDPNEAQRGSLLGADEVRDGQTADARGGNLPGADVYDDVPSREGLIDLSFTVKADGTVSDVELLGGFYDEKFRQEALDSIADTVFDPAKAGEAAIDWPQYRMRIFQRAPIMPSVSPEIAPELQRVTALITAKSYTDAEAAINELLATKAQTLLDYALLQDQLASVFIGTERPHEALIALRNATADAAAVAPPSRPDSRLQVQEERYPEEFLVPELYVNALKRRFAVAAVLNQTGEALNMADAIAARGEVPAELGTQADAIRAKLATEEPIASQVKLVNGSWTFEVSARHTFGMTGLQGQVDFVDIACNDNRRRRMDFTNDSEFVLPASWENCKLEFLGADGAAFLLYEFLN